MQSYTDKALEHMANCSVSSGNPKIKSDVDNDFNVIFTRPNRFTAKFIVTINTEKEPKIIVLDSHP